MKPLMMHGHERSITQIKYNLDGDLLFRLAVNLLFGQTWANLDKKALLARFFLILYRMQDVKLEDAYKSFTP